MLSRPSPPHERQRQSRTRCRTHSLAAREGLELHRPQGYKAKPRNPENATAAASPEPAFESTAEKSNATESSPLAEATGDKLQLAEVVVLITSGLIGRTLKQLRFAERYDAVVLALRRRGSVSERPSSTRLQAGNVLVEKPCNIWRTRAVFWLSAPSPRSTSIHSGRWSYREVQAREPYSPRPVFAKHLAKTV